MEDTNGKDVVEAVSYDAGPIKVYERTAIDMSTPEGIEQQTKRIEKYVESQVRIRRACIRVTNCNDWIDQEGKPYMAWTGASKIAGIFGVSYDTPKFTQTAMADDKGEYINITADTLIRYGGRSVPEIGSCTTRDQFFAQRSKYNEETKQKEKYYLPLSEIDINDIRKKALTNMLNRGLKSLLGLSFTWEEIAEATNGAITREKCLSIKHDKGGQGGNTDAPDTAALRSTVRKQLLEICGGDEAAAKERLKKLTTFTTKDNPPKTVSGKTSLDAVSEKQLQYLAKDVEKEHKAMFPETK